MKKTLLIAAAALAAGVISSQAQVYSLNVVGYINQPIPAGGYQIIGSDLVGGSDANQTNGDINATLGAGLVSSPVTAVGNPTQNPGFSTNSQLLVFSGGGFTTYFYFNAGDATSWEGTTSPAGWYDAGGNYASVDLTGGASAFIFNHSAIGVTNTVVGTVFQGTNVTQIKPGYNLIALQEPVGVTNVFVNSSGPLPYGLPLNLTSSNDVNAFQDTPTTTTQDSMLYWAGNGYITYFYFNSADATYWENSGGASPVYPAGFYDAGGLPGNIPSVNQGFFIFHIGSAVNWTNSFTVQ